MFVALLINDNEGDLQQQHQRAGSHASMCCVSTGTNQETMVQQRYDRGSLQEIFARIEDVIVCASSAAAVEC